jgi:TetR/AcrR family transcriptional repressor of nem operon
MPKPNVRDQILSAGLHALHERGFNATAVQDITAAAGVPKGSFYNHFDSKEALGAEVVRQYSIQAGARHECLHDMSLSPLQRLRRHFEMAADAVAQHDCMRGCLLGNFAAEMSGQSTLIRDSVALSYAAWADALAPIIAEAQQEGLVPNDFPAHTLAVFLVDAWQGSLLRAKIEKTREALDTFITFAFAKILA